MRLFKVVLSAFLSFLFLYGHSQNKENADKEQKECSTLDKKKLGTEFKNIFMKTWTECYGKILKMPALWIGIFIEIFAIIHDLPILRKELFLADMFL